MREQFKPLVGIDTPRRENGEYHILDHRDLDRYKTNSPFKYNKITINDGKYINASSISIGQQENNLFIATQGPKDNTIEDFWTMVWESKSKVIVMLTNLIEAEKIKCENYWEEKMDKFEVNAKEVEKKDMYLLREIRLKNYQIKKKKNCISNSFYKMA